MRHHRQLLLIMIFFGCVTFIGIGSWGVTETSEARYAEISREMVRSGDWMHPTLLGIHHFHKPPLIYWLTAMGYKIAGMNATGARFFLSIAFLIQLWLIYRITFILLKDKDQAIHAAVIFGGLPIVLASIRGVTTDPYLNTFILATVFCWMLWQTEKKVKWIYFYSTFLGLCFFTKGPVGLLIPVLVMIGLPRTPEDQKTSFSYHHFPGVVICIVISMSWFVLLAFEDKQFIDYFLFRHTVDRFAHAEVFTRTQPWWYYLYFGPLLALPWLLIFFFGPVSTWKKVPLSIRRIAIFWVIVPLIFFSLSSSKLVLYVLPIYSGVAIVCSGYLNSLDDRLPKFENVFFYFICFILLGSAITLLFIEPVSPSWAGLLPLLPIGILFIIKYYRMFSGLRRSISYSLCWSGFLILFASFIFHANELKVNSTAPLAEWIISNRMSDRQIIVYNRLLPSLSFNLDRTIISLNNGDRYLTREVQFEKQNLWKKTLYDLREPEEVSSLKKILTHPSVIISKKEIAEDAHWITTGFNGKVNIGDWVLFYN